MKKITSQPNLNNHTNTFHSRNSLEGEYAKNLFTFTPHFFTKYLTDLYSKVENSKK